MKWTADFWKGVAERALSTFLQALLAVMIVDGFDWLNADWGQILGTAGFAAVLSVIKSLVAGGMTGTASITKAEVPAGRTPDTGTINYTGQGPGGGG